MREYRVDLHVHVGYAHAGQVVKIPAGKDLTVRGIVQEVLDRSQVEILGIVDCGSPLVLEDLRELLEAGWGRPLPGGGLCFAERLTVLLGVEVELAVGQGFAHWLAYFPTLEKLQVFCDRLSPMVTNPNLSTQRVHTSAPQFAQLVASCQGILIPAHIFTPFKSVYGSCGSSIAAAFGSGAQVAAVELGLSADTDLADQFLELHPYTFLSNSDAHSLETIGREYNRCLLDQPDFTELVRALARDKGRRVVGNFGLDPALGKYHRTFCRECGQIGSEGCHHRRKVQGVYDYIEGMKDLSQPKHPAFRPPYYYRYPLSYIPGIGAKTRERLLAAFPNEEYILRQATLAELTAVAGNLVARRILMIREGDFRLQPGAGGRYGRILLDV